MIGHSVRVLKLVMLFARFLGVFSFPSNSSVTEAAFGENADVAAGVDPVIVELVAKASLTIAGML